MKRSSILSAALFLLSATTGFATPSNRPNIVLIFPDNIGSGEVASFGGARGVPTPNIDRVGSEGIRLTNFNVEYSCTPSRIAVLTGRYAARASQDNNAGMTRWEKTIPEALQPLGYATAIFGKWDLGGPDWQGKREPTQQGFDEWYGIPETSHASQFATFPGFDPATQETPYVWAGTAGSPATKVKPFDLAARRTLDREIAEHGVAFIEKNAKQDRPFFLYLPMTQLHFPALPHPDKAGTTGAGDMGDAMADLDHNLGLILRALERLKIEENTLVVWCGDNGAEMRRPWRGSSGPWRGYYNSAMEGGIRAPFVMRWPGRIPAGQVSNEIIHEMDLFPTIAAAVQAPEIIPQDRAIDGVSQLAFLEGKQSRTNRDSVIFLEPKGSVMAVKWRNWKFWYSFKTELPDAEPDNLVRLFDLAVDPREEIDVKDHFPWVVGIMDRIVKDYETSLTKYPRTPANAPDPYTPPPVGSGAPTATYTRTDRLTAPAKSKALPKPDFSGTWSTTVLQTRSPIARVDVPVVPTLGSGWGDKISIRHTPDTIEVERVLFSPRDLQATVRYHFALDGSMTENNQNVGRSDHLTQSSAAWDGHRFVATTWFPVQDPATGQISRSKLVQTLWLQAANAPPFEPTLVVETLRESALGGIPSVSRTIYSKGYR
jgi:arylsulfatase